MLRDGGTTGARDRTWLQECLAHAGQVVGQMDHALDRAEARVASLLETPMGAEAPPAWVHACQEYAATVAAVTHTRQQLFDLPMLVTLLAHAPPEERPAALRRIAQVCSGLSGIATALDAAATHVVQAWQATRCACGVG
jgi:hypothetical protein